MGTRHLIAVQLDGEYKIAQYGQWDGYPTGQGKDVLQFARTIKPGFRDRVRAAKFATEEEVLATYEEFGGIDARGCISYDKAKARDAKHPALSRDTGAKVLNIVQDSTSSVLLRDSIDFVGDSLFCEWAYVIDLDKNTFEVFQGFNKEPLDSSERFANAPREQRDGKFTEYHQVKHLATFALNNLPSEKVFLEVCAPKEDE